MADPKSKTPEWRKQIDDVPAKLYELARWLDQVDSEGSMHDFAVVVKRAAHLLISAGGNVKAEERHAWDMYAAAGGVMAADHMLEERRKRFSQKEPTNG